MRSIARCNGRHRRHVSGGEPRADGLAAAESPGEVLRPGRAGRHHPARSDRRQDDAPVYAATPEEGRGDVSASLAGTGAQAHAGCAALSGTTAAHGDGGRQFHRRGSRRTAPRRRHAPLLGADEESRRQAARRHDGERTRCCDAGEHHPEHQFLRAVRLSRVACRQLRSDRLCLGIFQSEVSRRVHLRDSEQSADGLLHRLPCW